ncbi:unnamed protein product [Heligmosomoides polygyrus]|uniref:Uncharacterized protein n=1 Tax=Heligmosomoides polygyrus TaxID=6339 RepID=A0A183F6I5_HELPZ|nr:unnamed protein product [Heligmosomoides polygyrus]
MLFVRSNKLKERVEAAVETANRAASIAQQKCGPPLDKKSSREEIKLGERMASILKDFEARQLEVDEGKQLEVVEEEEEDWDPQDELMDVESQASSEHLIRFRVEFLVEERVRLQLDLGCVLITLEEDTAINYTGTLYLCITGAEHLSPC